MSDEKKVLAWLEPASGGRVPITGTCSIGRLSSNTLMLADERVSRRHALINVQDQEFWLVDLGSGNGTYLNGRRAVQPTRLRDGDKIEIGSFQLQFHQSAAARETTPPAPETSSEQTLQQIQSLDCWLLVADIEDSTQLIRNTPTSDLPLVTGRWLEECRLLVERHGGSVNKFLGDGFFAYWRAGGETEVQVAATLQALAAMQQTARFAFRFVLHHGHVFMGGGASLGEESLQGKEVHFVFRMEKLAGNLGERSLVSAAATAALPATVKLIECGAHSVAGFDGEHAFYSLADSPMPS